LVNDYSPLQHQADKRYGAIMASDPMAVLPSLQNDVIRSTVILLHSSRQKTLIFFDIAYRNDQLP